jgi:hypothetical protein
MLVPGIPSVLRLPAVAAAPIGSTLGATSIGVNPPSVSPIVNAANRSLLPSAPSLDVSSNALGSDRAMIIPMIVTLMAVRP